MNFRELFSFRQITLGSVLILSSSQILSQRNWSHIVTATFCQGTVASPAQYDDKAIPWKADRAHQPPAINTVLAKTLGQRLAPARAACSSPEPDHSLWGVSCRGEDLRGEEKEARSFVLAVSHSNIIQNWDRWDRDTFLTNGNITRTIMFWHVRQ